MGNTLTKKNDYIKHIVIAGVLTAFSLIIPLLPFKLPLPQPFSVTFAAHVPTLLAMFFSPWVAVCTVIGSTVGFLISVGPIVAIRAASHIIFALVGAFMLKKESEPLFGICYLRYPAWIGRGRICVSLWAYAWFCAEYIAELPVWYGIWYYGLPSFG